MSRDAVSIMERKLPMLKEFGVKAKIWDMTKGKSDEELNAEGWYNCDLEDVIRKANELK